MTIYELTGDWLGCYDLADDPECDEELWFSTMEKIEACIEDKFEGYGRIIKQLASDEEGIKKEAEVLAKKAKRLKRLQDGLKERQKMCMEAIGKDTVKTEHFTFKIQKNGGKLPLIIDESVGLDELPEDYLTYTVTINTDAVRRTLDKGGKLDFAKYGERGTSLRIK